MNDFFECHDSMKPCPRPQRALLVLILAALSGLGGCASKKHVKLPASAPPASTLQSYGVEDLLIYHEGLRLKPYADSENTLTIGVGRNLDHVGISKEEALFLLRNDIARVSKELDANLPWWRSLSETRQKVLVSMAFNLGMGGLLSFTEMLSALESGDYAEAAAQMLASRWASQVGNRAVELAYMMENG